MVVPVDPNRTEEYVDEIDLLKDGGRKPDASVFLIGGLAEAQRARCLDAVSAYDTDPDAEGDVRIYSGTLRRLRLRYGLRGVVRGFPGWETEPDALSPERQVPTDRFLGTIPDSVARRMADQIGKLMDVSEDDQGKSERLSGSPTTRSLGEPAEGAPD